MKYFFAVLPLFACLSTPVVGVPLESTISEEVAAAEEEIDEGAMDEIVSELLDPGHGLLRPLAKFPQCGEVSPFVSPCEELCPEACTDGTQIHPCGCEDFGIGQRCVCPL